MKLIDREEMWFGEYGGCFVADAFSIQCDEYYEAFTSAIADEQFQVLYKDLKDKFIKNNFEVLDNDNDITVLLASENYYSIIGTAALAKYLN
ncbi:hypothetical protein, partial [Anaerorhabdus sp.]|uniref:hypothetical protein n=1 Tax=Anaerorhabdus sp. TaxID=1872524 RepID=UPI002B209CBF